MLRGVLYHLLDQNDTFFLHYQKAFRESKGQWTYAYLKVVLESLASHPVPTRIYFVLDALDESQVTDRRDILETFYELCTSCTRPRNGSPNHVVVKVFLSSRPVSELACIGASNFHQIELQEFSKDAIANYTDSFLQKLDFPDDIRFLAKANIIERAQGVFLWVNLVMKALIRFADTGCCPDEILDLLKGLPSELEGMYGLIVQQLKDHEPRDIRTSIELFRLVIFARRPFTIGELRDALAMSVPSNPEVDFSPDERFLECHRIINIDKRIVYCGGNFVDIKKVHGMTTHKLTSILLRLKADQ